MIVATAGHVDHGKTLLVKALTGIDADRLPEEKKRGMTIDLGFAYLPVEGRETIGFVDVPGHERFIHNMLCGIGGIDFALLIVAADDGPMPQTQEHLGILDLLGVRSGAIALTKVDRVPLSRANEVAVEVTGLVAGTSLAGSPVFPVSAMTGEGIDALKRHLLLTASNLAARAEGGNFRLSVDRCFTIAGAGLVVTGTALSGSLAAGDTVRVLHAGLAVRARTIHAQNAPAQRARAGQRCALNLAGPGLRDHANPIRRGDWIVTGEVPLPVRRIDARLRILKGEAHRFAHRTPVHVHLGAADVTGRVAVLEGSAIDPGCDALVQLVLDHPVGAVCGDRFIVRDTSARRTIGGGQVIDVFPSLRGRAARARPERLAFLRGMENGSHATSLQSLMDISPHGLNVSQFAGNRNLTSSEAAGLVSQLALKPVTTAEGALVFAPANWHAWRLRILEALAASHRRSPNAFGPAEDRVLAEAGVWLPAEAALAITAELIGEGAIVKGPYGVRLPWHLPQLKPADAALWKKVQPLLEANPLRPPTVHEIAAAIREDPPRIESLMARAARLLLVVQVAKNRFFSPEAVRRLARIAEELAAESNNHLVAAGPFRDRSGVGRNVAVEVLQFFDRIKFMRRVGDAHEVLRPASEVMSRESRMAPGTSIQPVGRRIAGPLEG